VGPPRKLSQTHRAHGVPIEPHLIVFTPHPIVFTPHLISFTPPQDAQKAQEDLTQLKVDMAAAKENLIQMEAASKIAEKEAFAAQQVCVSDRFSSLYTDFSLFATFTPISKSGSSNYRPRRSSQ
jgi:hypothetical protein